MPTIRQSIDIGVPVHTAYQHLTRFEDYPRFMQEVDTVQQIDDTHLHWAARLSYQPMEWDAEITEQSMDRCIAWRNVGGPVHEGRLDLQALGPDKSRITLTMESDPEQLAAVSAVLEGDGAAAMAQQLEQDLERFRQFIEAGATEAPPDPAGTQSAAALSRTGDQPDDGRFSIAEEQNFDQQSDQARRVGQMPEEASQAVSQSMRQDEHDTQEKARLKQSMARAVPPSE
jgi:uncharacterized membrane protein